MHSKRKLNFKRMYNIFKKYEQWIYLPETLPQADPSWFGFLITLKDNCIFEKNDLVEYLENAKIQTRSYFTGNALFHPAYEELAANYENPKEQFPIATKSSKDTFFMGVYPGLTEEQLDYIEVVVDEFFQNLK